MSYSEIKGTLNSTVGTDKFRTLNEMLDEIRMAIERSSGQTTKMILENKIFEIPEGVSQLTISAIAAGGNGNTAAGNFAGDALYIRGGKGGNSGEEILEQKFDVGSNKTIDITVGAGNTILTFKKSDETITQTITLLKGNGSHIGGSPSTSNSTYSTGGGGAGGLFNAENGYIPKGGGTGAGNGGSTVNISEGSVGTGGTGQTATYPSFNAAKGGNGSTLGVISSVKYDYSGFALGGGGGGGGYGAGGGGGGGGFSGNGYSNPSFGTGGTGANGVVIIEW